MSQDVPQVQEDIENEVIRRYAEGAQEVEASLCCPVSYDDSYLKILPQEIIDKDYGCGDPSRYAVPGDIVLDLGSGGGKICYILSQLVGAKGKVIGVDFNDTMLALARKYLDEMAEKVGYANVEFRKGKIQDLGLDFDRAEAFLEAHPVAHADGLQKYEVECERLRREEPLIETNSIDLIVSNCVLNLVKPEDKLDLFRDMYRVTAPGGRAVISDIVCDRDPGPEILADPELWSGCIAGAFREDRFIDMFAEAGFQGMEILVRQDEPWRVIDDVEFRSMTVRAWKPQASLSLETKEMQVVYAGPWHQATDDRGRTFTRGQRTSISEAEYQGILDGKSALAGHLILVDGGNSSSSGRCESGGSACC
jgi:ubiquinone/menaquinone biosynthesis C-methylase UbiE